MPARIGILSRRSVVAGADGDRGVGARVVADEDVEAAVVRDQRESTAGQGVLGGDRREGEQRAEGEAANAANAANAARPGEWEPGQTTPSSGDSSLAADSESDPGKAHCLAETRGRDWGLPDAARGSVPITRPIRIDLDATRVVLVPERGLGSEKQIELQGDTTDTIDDLVSAVWGHMESWGIAGRGMYWRPILKVRVGPGAERRFADLKILLEGSGIEVGRSDELPILNSKP